MGVCSTRQSGYFSFGNWESNLEKLPNSKTCFVCGDRNPSGLRVRFWLDGEAVFTRFTPRKDHMGYHGVTHGGVIASLLDETMGWAPCLQNRRFCVSIELHIEYLKPIPIGREITVTGRASESNRRIWSAEGEVTDSEGTVYARGKGRYIPISDEQTRDVVSYLQFDEETVAPERIYRAVMR
jgi:uncharacterized protein (TIGR00369 family)